MSAIASRTFRKLVIPSSRVRALSSKPPTVKNFINGKFEESKTQQWIEVVNPATQDVVSLLPQTTAEELARAEAGAHAAYLEWKEVSVSQRQRVFFKFQQLIRDHTEELAHSITTEQGKTLADARGDVFRGLEVIESACGIAPLMMGETLGNLSRGIDTVSYRQPLGVTAGNIMHSSVVLE
jgi:malonate-semialdehyde dehydrogenase (acetylating) / methylmalonate-semialdehyde dehydrogenase